MARQYLIAGHGYANVAEAGREYLWAGRAYLNEAQAAAPAPTEFPAAPDNFIITS